MTRRKPAMSLATRLVMFALLQAGVVFATVSHELRTPLARVRVALELLYEDADDATNTALGAVSTDLAEVESMLDDIFTASRLDAETSAVRGSVLRRAEAVDAIALARSAVARVEERAPERGFELVSQLESPCSLQVHVVLVRRALENLMLNAHEHTPLPERPVLLRVRNTAGGVAFDVIDEGTGMNAIRQRSLFEPFVRGPQRADAPKGREGLGLGRVLVKRIVDAHGGSIDLETVAGKGTRVTVVLPAAA